MFDDMCAKLDIVRVSGRNCSGNMTTDVIIIGSLDS
jgi:hypothetical protein